MESNNFPVYINDDRLFNYAASEAKLFNGFKPGNAKSEAKALRAQMENIRRVRDELSRRSASLSSLPACWEWLLDNFYLLQREYIGTFRALREAKNLRRSRGSLLIFSLCRSLLSCSQGKISEKRCRIYLKGFQSGIVLSRAELCLFPAVLKAEIISAVSRLCSDMQYSPDSDPLTSSMEALITSLRHLALADTQKLLDSCNAVSEILSHDPTGEYSHMDEATKQDYLRQLEILARKAGLEEQVYARFLIEKAGKENAHIGFYLFPQPPAYRAALYIALNVFLSLFFSLLPAFYLGSPPAALLLLLPISELVKSLIDFILLHTVKPHRPPRMDISRGIADEGRSIVVVSALLTDSENLKKLCRNLEELYYSCRNKTSLSFALLADLKEADEKEMSEDEELIDEAKAAINALNRKYGGGFYFFTRERRFDGEKYCAKERKRGAIMELCSLISDKKSELQVCGERDALFGTRYMIALDSDTKVYPGAIEELISAMLHPLCRAVIDEQKRIVTRGHGIIQPRISTELGSAGATDFSLIFAGSGGSDPYGGLCGELYMDAFGSGGFSGKGIIDLKALEHCLSSRLPEGRILSHDALEGAFLRAAFMGDTEFSDSFPAKPLSYYKRLHRWIRGDVQNLSYVFCPALPPIERWRLFDSVRRALTAPMTLFAIVLGFFLPEKGLVLSAGAALLALLSRLILSFAEEGLRNREKIRIRRYTRLLSGIGGAIVSSFMRLWLLPYEAWICIWAISVSLWRMLISGKRLLQWQTSAQSESLGNGLTAHIRAMWFPVALGLLLLGFSPVIIGKSAGLMWLLSPVTALALSLPAHKEQYLSRADREFILNAARENYRYFEEFCTEYDNFLPPDNFQEQPPVGLAHRTSPTNIGLALCSYVAAADMGIIEKEQAAENIGKMLLSVEKLKKYRGQLYNWYDTRSLNPLHPAFVSAVDSGNLYACLVCLRQALSEWGEYKLLMRTDELMAAMDFSFLYDNERNLFYICYDTENHRGAGGWYDIMASEALLLSYISLAKGDVPVKHWRRLSRAQLQKDGYRGLASWTGTMFEYLMPEIFLPLYRGSLLYESARFCLYVQKRQVFAGKPWGISESAFYALDRAMNYRYKANGCGALALKRGQDEDMIVSPYSSFLALVPEPQAAVKNLRRLKAFGAAGRFGFIEALDFTPSRCRRDEGEKVRCYMAHHIGMSICSCANALCDLSLQRRFMQEPAMAANRLLLQERLPADGLIIKRSLAQPAEVPRRRFDGFWENNGHGGKEKYCLLSNCIYNILCSSSGSCSASWGDVRIYGSGEIPMEASPALGIKIFSDKEELLPSGMDKWSLGEDACAWESEKGPVILRHSLVTGAECAGELRESFIHARENVSLELKFSFIPILAPYRDYKNHPAFWRLGLNSQLYDGKLLLRRIRRGGNQEIWLCISSDLPSEFSSEDGQIKPYLSDPEVTVKTSLSLKAGEKLSHRLALCIGRSRDEVLKGADALLQSQEKGSMAGAAAARLGMNEKEYQSAMDMLPALLTPLSNAAPRKELWQYGISGDLPYICCDAQASEAEGLLNSFCLLTSCGIEAELIYLSSEEGEYRRPFRRKISERLESLSLQELIGIKGGIHFAPTGGKEIIESRASFIPARARREYYPLTFPVLSAPRQRGSIPEFTNSDGKFNFTVKDSLPSRVWQQIITNGHFSCLVSDCGMGTMWFENAREMRITEAPDDFRGVSGSEALWINSGSRKISLFAANDGYKCKVSFYPGTAVWEKEIEDKKIRLSAFVPAGINARVYIIEGTEALQIDWAVQPVLGAPDPSSLKCRKAGDIIEFENPESYLSGIKFRIGCSGTFTAKTDYSPAALKISLWADKTAVLVCGTLSENELKELCSGDFALSAMREARRRRTDISGRFSVKSSCPALDNYLNFWAPYQAIACRLEGRSSLYQSGGAFGFRDQLQDSINVLLISPDYARRQILDCCRHQYAEGDVMHWWHPHPDGDKGIRSRCSDDLLWLCWALCEYCLKTGGCSLCYEKVPFSVSMPLKDEERDRYEIPGISEGSDTVLNHVRRALNCCIQRGLGPHGLPYFGSGDWNDGLDEVDGESVWLGWFFSLCALNFSKLLTELSEPDASYYRNTAERLGKAADRAWSGSFYYRGYLSDGTPLGGEDRLDSLPQSFAAFSPYADPRKVRTALRSSLNRLWDRENKIVKLFDPPYSPDEPYRGYIVSYGEGFRENGGQYTHAGVWLASACFKRGLKTEGKALMLALLPENHEAAKYEAEPFVLPADVYSSKAHEGEAGWTWYTGSAGWYYKVAAEDMLGLKLNHGRMDFNPALLPSELSFSAEYKSFEGETLSFSNFSDDDGGRHRRVK